MNSCTSTGVARGTRFSFCLLLFLFALTPGLAGAQKPQVPANPLVPGPRKGAEPPPSPAAPAPQLTAADVSAFLDGVVPLQLERNDIAGAVVVVVKDGQVLFAKGYGYADREKKKPVSPADTLFRPGSISKLFTWTAVMQLQQEGKLDLDRDVTDYLDFKVPPKFGRPVTLRNLMTHTPGFEETLKQIFVARPEQMQPLGEYERTHLPARIFPPGTTPAYSNYGAALAGYIVQRVSGERFEDYVRDHILQPLGMTHSTFVQPLPPALQATMSQGYKLGSGKPQVFELIPASPAGALSASGLDIAHFMIAHLHDGEYQGQSILRPETARLMHAPQFSLSPALNAMALGFYEESRNGHRILGHGGDTMWFHSDLHLVLDQDLGFFISGNSAGRGGISLRTAVWQKFLDRYFPYQPPAAAPVATKVADARAVSGSYESSRRSETNFLRLGAILGEASVTANSDGTIGDEEKKFNGQPKRFEEIGPLLYREVDGQDKIAFLRDPTGGYTMTIDFPAIAFHTVPWYANGTLVLSLIVAAVAIAVLTLVFWPIGALTRWHYRAKFPVPAGERRLRILVKLVCLLDLLAWGAWGGIVYYGADDITRLTPALDLWMHLAEVLTMAGVIAALIPLYNAVRGWTRERWWWSKMWDTVIALGCVAFAWVSIFGHLWSWNVKY